MNSTMKQSQDTKEPKRGEGHVNISDKGKTHDKLKGKTFKRRQCPKPSATKDEGEKASIGKCAFVDIDTEEAKEVKVPKKGRLVEDVAEKENNTYNEAGLSGLPRPSGNAEGVGRRSPVLVRDKNGQVSYGAILVEVGHGSCVDCEGHSGGSAIFWKKEVTVHPNTVSRLYLDMDVVEKDDFV